MKQEIPTLRIRRKKAHQHTWEIKKEEDKIEYREELTNNLKLLQNNNDIDNRWTTLRHETQVTILVL